MSSLSIALACDADLCALYPKIRKIRESMTIERATELGCWEELLKNTSGLQPQVNYSIWR